MKIRYVPGMAFDLVETIKFVGGLSGLATASFLIYDRLIRSRPIVSFRPHNNGVDLVIRNAMPESLIIEGITVTPPYLGIASGDDVRSVLTTIVAAAVDSRAQRDIHTSRAFLIVDPVAEKTQPLVWLVNANDLSASESIKFRCRWRSTGRPIFFKRTITASTTVEDMSRMLDDAKIKGPMIG